MAEDLLTLPQKKNIALVAHDNKKKDLLEWALFNAGSLKNHNLYATGTTGSLIQKALGQKVSCFNSGPFGGDQQIGAAISQGQMHLLIFFWDPLNQLPHDPDIKALLRLAAVWNIPVACNRATADFLISSELFNKKYTKILPDYSAYLNRFKNK